MSTLWDIFKFLLPFDISSVSMKNRIIISLFWILIPTTVGLIAFIFSKEVYFLLLCIPVILIMGGLFFSLICFERLNEKYSLFSDIRFGNTYQSEVLLYIEEAPGLFSLTLILGLILGKCVVGFGIGLSFLIPAILMFLRINVFNDDSSLVFDDSGNKSVVFGFKPFFYYFVSVIIGLYGYFVGFNKLSHSASFIWIFIVFLFQLVLIFPDKFDKYLPFEIRTKKGCGIFLVGVLILFVLFVAIFQPILLNSVFSLHITWYGILKLIIECAVALILLKFILKKIKKEE